MTGANGRDDLVLDVQDLRTYFFTRWGIVKAVDGVSFNLHRGETLGIVGESGSGKSVTSLSIMRLVPSPPGQIVGGQVMLENEDVLKYSEGHMENIRGAKIAMVLQDPMTALNPVFNIGNQVGEALKIHKRIGGQALKEQVIDMLRKVRIPAPETRVRDYPHQFSGGMRQRVVGAIGISCDPVVLIADEPTTSLDATVQAQYLRLLKDLQQETGVAIIFITHDFGIVAKMCDRVAVMYAGKVVEQEDVRQIFSNPLAPLHRSAHQLRAQDGREGRTPVLDSGTAASVVGPAGGLRVRAQVPLRSRRLCRISPVFDVAKGQTAACWLRAGGES